MVDKEETSRGQSLRAQWGINQRVVQFNVERVALVARKCTYRVATYAAFATNKKLLGRRQILVTCPLPAQAGAQRKARRQPNT